ncbi:MAG: aspartyl/asparaginyl beta-hydroxylase domain-containing protein [Porphyrobacter sp.]|nr:aspartyl/asparaginyl beta-hydroxylase domain-containing protein [Porphyrobacter sp.]
MGRALDFWDEDRETPRMRFDKPLLRLPITFCAETLAAEVNALPSSAWMPHPQGFAGNDAVPLVAADGGLNDRLRGVMAPTEHLARCPYIVALMAELGGVWGRSRLMGLGAGAEVPGHVDTNYYWRTHIRIHIPVITNPQVTFTCGNESVHMAAGECWTFDSFQRHNVQNKGTEKRVHLVLDTVGGERLWALLDAAGRDSVPSQPWMPGARELPPLSFERVNTPWVMTPWEMRCHLDYLAGHLPVGAPARDALGRMERFISTWHATWAQFGEHEEGQASYRQLIETARTDLKALGAGDMILNNNVPFAYALDALIFANALTRTRAEPGSRATASVSLAS